ncbi:hypothetical protein ACFL5P_00430 [candidate division KSB1 bacterium]
MSMKVILSRKGFDSSAGGYPSPILPNGTLLSIPIPAKNRIKYSELKTVLNLSYFDVMSQIYPNMKINGKTRPLDTKFECHRDPDLDVSAYPREKGWQPLFGQTGAALSHLNNQNIQVGDIFLFYGLFRKVIVNNNQLQFDKHARPIHVIFGYLQVGMIHKIDSDFKALKWMQYHPHILNKSKRKNSVIFEAAKDYSTDEHRPRAGVFKYHDSLVLTKNGCSPSQWELPEFFRDVNISYHCNSSKYGWKDDYFQSALRGQEFVIEENSLVNKWAMMLIKRFAQKS